MENNERICDVGSTHRLIEDTRSLPFGTDALLLAAAVRPCRGDIIELGAGSGVVSLLLAARNKGHHIVAVEVRDDMAAILERNIALNSLTGRVSALRCDLRELPSDLNCSFAAVVANPPYMKADSGREGENDASNASRRELAGTIFDFAARASKLLCFGGSFYCVYRPERMADLFEAMRASGCEPKRATMVYATKDHPPCLVIVEAKKGAKPSLAFSAPLFLQDEHGKESEEYKRIVESGYFINQ